MRSRVTRIGSSYAIRVPIRLLREAGLFDEVDLEVKGGQLIVSPAGRARAGWEAAFAEMARRHDDEPVDYLPTEFDAEEWEW